MAAFGWSAGDLVQAVTVIYKVGKALKDSGGASEDYQEAITFLQSLALTLNTLRNFDGSSGTSAEDAAVIRAQVDCIREPVQCFLNKIESKFELKLGAKSKKGIRGALLGGHRRVEWALSVSKDVKALNERITVPLCAIQIKMGMQML